MNRTLLDDLLVRPAITTEGPRSDAVQIADIYNHYVDVGGATFDRDHWPVDRVTKFLQVSPPDGWYVADLRGKLLGWASARQFSDRQGYKHACETAIYLSPEAIGCRVAQPLQLAVDQHCREHRIHHAVAKIIANNDRSMSFHYRSGYQLVGIQNEIGFINDQWVDVAILQKIFD